AFDALRLERGFRSWGHDMGQTDDPYESGLGFTVNGAKAGGFVGREALAGFADAAWTRRLASVRLSDPDAPLWHGESVLLDGGGGRAGEAGGVGTTPGG